MFFMVLKNKGLQREGCGKSGGMDNGLIIRGARMTAGFAVSVGRAPVAPQPGEG
jgi:hypothetical protein